MLRAGWKLILLLAYMAGAVSCANGTTFLTLTEPARDTVASQTQPPTATLPATASPTLPVDTLTPTLSPTPAPSSTPTATIEPVLRFAVIGDYGQAGGALAEVAALIDGWRPELILTTGDNNYPIGAAETIDANIGQYFSAYIAPYQGAYGEGSELNRFFPTMGNHDWLTDGGQPYLEYFTLPGNERYYDFTWGPVHFFALDSDSHEPDGVGRSSPQAAWLQAALAQSSLPWQVVYMHHPPYSSGLHGAVDWTRWPYAEWGADVVFSGHDHTYERLSVDGIPYFVNGLGGGAVYYFETIDPHSQVRYNADYGAILVQATSQFMEFQFFNRRGELIDAYRIERAD